MGCLQAALTWSTKSSTQKKQPSELSNATEENKKKPLLALYSSFVLLQLLHRYNTPDKIDSYKPAHWIEAE